MASSQPSVDTQAGVSLKPDLGTGMSSLLLVCAGLRNLLALALPIGIIQIYDRVIPNQAYETLVLLIIAMLVAMAMETLVGMAADHIRRESSLKHAHELTDKAVGRFLNGEPTARDALSSGWQLNAFKAIEQLQDFHGGRSHTQFVDILFAALNIGLIWYYAGVLVWIPLVLIGVFCLLALGLSRTTRSLITDRAHLDAQRQDFLTENLKNINLVRALAIESNPVASYQKMQGDIAENAQKTVQAIGVLQGLGIFIVQLIIVTFLCFGALAVIGGELGLGALAACTLLAGRVLQPFLRGVAVWTVIQHVSYAMRTAKSLLDLPVDPRGKGNRTDVTRGTIKLSEVHFKFPGASEPLLSGLDLLVPAGHMIGITGANGGGKTTLMRLMIGGITPTQGSVTIDCHHANTIAADQIGVMSQTGTLFAGTVLDNILMGRDLSRLPRFKEFSEALGLTDALRMLPNGLDTEIPSSYATGLPGGVEQLILAVRSVVQEPKILFVDQANSLLDRAADERFIRFLRTYAGTHTVVVTTHRPSLLAECNAVYRLEEGMLIPLDLNIQLWDSSSETRVGLIS